MKNEMNHVSMDDRSTLYHVKSQVINSFQLKMWKLFVPGNYIKMVGKIGFIVAYFEMSINASCHIDIELFILRRL